MLFFCQYLSKWWHKFNIAYCTAYCTVIQIYYHVTDLWYASKGFISRPGRWTLLRTRSLQSFFALRAPWSSRSAENATPRTAAEFFPHLRTVSWRARAVAWVQFLPERQENQRKRQFALHSATCGTPQSFFVTSRQNSASYAQACLIPKVFAWGLVWHKVAQLWHWFIYH